MGSPSKRSALQCAFDNDGSLGKKPRNRPDLSVEQQVRTAIANNLKGFTGWQLDTLKVNGSLWALETRPLLRHPPPPQKKKKFFGNSFIMKKKGW